MRVSTRLAGWAVVLALAACEAVATAPSEPAAGRPAGVSEGLRAAVVVAVVGAATVQPSQGAAYAAGPDQELLADDTIVTAADGFVMLELHNGHVVRVRSGDGLRVDRTAAFAEPAVAGALADRLAAAMSQEESGDPRLRVAARVAGWNMRMTSARTFGAQQQQQQSRPTVESKADGRPGEEENGEAAGAGTMAPGHGQAAPAPPTAPIAETSDADPVLDAKTGPVKNAKVSTKERGRIGEGKGPPTPAPPTSKPDSSPVSEAPTDSPKQSKSPETSVSLDLPESVDFTPDGGSKRSVGLPGPLRAKRAELAKCAGKGVQIRGEVKGGKLVKLEFPGADRCGVGIVGGKIALEDGWLELRVKP